MEKETKQIDNDIEQREEINSSLKEFVRKFKKQKIAVAAAAFVGVFIILAIIGPYIVPYGINQADYNNVLSEPSLKHLFGTDNFGRDIFSRVISGTRISFFVGLSSVTFGAVVGSILGLVAGYYGGIVDSIIMRIADTLFAFPGIILAIGIVAILGPGIYNVVIAVAVFSVPTFSRIVRGNTLALKKAVYVERAVNLGASDKLIMFKHILPGSFSNIIVYYTMKIGDSILTAASLSFLGMGAQPPSPEWGAMLTKGKDYIGMSGAWQMTIFPGIAIFLTVLAFNLLGDGLRDALDPKLSN